MKYHSMKMVLAAALMSAATSVQAAYDKSTLKYVKGVVTIPSVNDQPIDMRHFLLDSQASFFKGMGDAAVVIDGVRNDSIRQSNGYALGFINYSETSKNLVATMDIHVAMDGHYGFSFSAGGRQAVVGLALARKGEKTSLYEEAFQVKAGANEAAFETYNSAQAVDLKAGDYVLTLSVPRPDKADGKSVNLTNLRMVDNENVLIPEDGFNYHQSVLHVNDCFDATITVPAMGYYALKIQNRTTDWNIQYQVSSSQSSFDDIMTMQNVRNAATMIDGNNLYTGLLLFPGKNYIRIRAFAKNAPATAKVSFSENVSDKQFAIIDKVVLLPNGTGNVGSVLGNASNNLYKLNANHHLLTSTTSQLYSLYDELVKAFSQDYTTAAPKSMSKIIEAIASREVDMTSGEGQPISNGDSLDLGCVTYSNNDADKEPTFAEEGDLMQNGEKQPVRITYNIDNHEFVYRVRPVVSGFYHPVASVNAKAEGKMTVSYLDNDQKMTTFTKKFGATNGYERKTFDGNVYLVKGHTYKFVVSASDLMLGGISFETVAQKSNQLPQAARKSFVSTGEYVNLMDAGAGSGDVSQIMTTKDGKILYAHSGDVATYSIHNRVEAQYNLKFTTGLMGGMNNRSVTVKVVNTADEKEIVNKTVNLDFNAGNLVYSNFAEQQHVLALPKLAEGDYMVVVQFNAADGTHHAYVCDLADLRFAQAVTMDETEDYEKQMVNATVYADVTLLRSNHDEQFNTIWLPFDLTAAQLKASFGEQTDVCRLTGVKNNYLQFSSSTNGITHGVPYLMTQNDRNEEIQINDVTVYPVQQNVQSQYGKFTFTGNKVASYAGEKGDYYMKGTEWSLVEPGQSVLPAFQCYLHSTDGTPVKYMGINVNGLEYVPTGINTVETNTAAGVRLNLAGQRVGNGYKGIVIEGGKKKMQ